MCHNEGLNEYYCRFDDEELRRKNEDIVSILQGKWQRNSETDLCVTEHEVRRLFDNLALNKAPGPRWDMQ